MGFSVLLVGRRYSNSPPIEPRKYTTTRLRLFFRKGPLFYAEFNIRLFFLLLTSRCHLLLSNDLDTLPASVLAAKLKRLPVVYDSHEYFTEVPELIHRPAVRRLWKWIEKLCLPAVSSAYTVSRSIAEAYERMYNVPFAVVRNIPNIPPFLVKPSDPLSGQPNIIYQGALNMGRGLEKAIEAMQYIPEATLTIAGGGDVEESLHRLAKKLPTPNVRFTGRLTANKLAKLTQVASLGISLEEDMGLNYRYALPNKLFDYIHAGIPVVVSNLPEMRRIVEQYNIGLISASSSPGELANLFRKALFDSDLRREWAKGIELARKELNWENEQEILIGIFSGYI
jgi:glycosyltransferase involved in cell wall biosynthesis